MLIVIFMHMCILLCTHTQTQHTHTHTYTHTHTHTYTQTQTHTHTHTHKHKYTHTYTQTHTHTHTHTHTAGPLGLARKILESDSEPFFVLNSDIICNYPFKRMLELHKSHENEGTIVVGVSLYALSIRSSLY